ncbi:MAG: type II secretion system major pseudopilin GspG [Gammaproteobacteria bacterium]|jgi:general secretion pathway protein G|nr:type II secretion system protein GspG [Chromatiales bacterium]MDP6415381.1 type II secretion system major pseudopilin GspG [Gammaproteobacteria bacterium]MDP6674080.1 type II secretion system major pseudopilin GspG [Gammaproteobacteria bacterium]
MPQNKYSGQNRSRPSSKGFTLIELLVVLVILGLLAGLVGPQVMKHVGDSKTKAAALQIEELSAALDIYRLEVGHYPASAQGLQALVQQPENQSGWNGPYLRKRVVPKDPWSQEYHYRYPGENGDFDLYSLGADNAAGGSSENTDIVSWE